MPETVRIFTMNNVDLMTPGDQGSSERTHKDRVPSEMIGGVERRDHAKAHRSSRRPMRRRSAQQSRHVRGVLAACEDTQTIRSWRADCPHRHGRAVSQNRHGDDADRCRSGIEDAEHTLPCARFPGSRRIALFILTLVN